ncbi:MAG: transposase [Cyanobacteria bacterium REEB67]|nr:transposase [Cyanobacteria bacterium REEB67]
MAQNGWLRSNTNRVKKEPFQVKKSTANSRVQQLTFDLLPQKPIELAFDGEDVSGSGGLLLAAQAEKFTGFLKGAAAQLTDHRTQSLIKHNTFEQVAQRVFQIMAGFPAGDDSDFRRHDPALKAAVGRNPLTGNDLASQPTQSRFENSRSYKEL